MRINRNVDAITLVCISTHPYSDCLGLFVRHVIRLAFEGVIEEQSGLTELVLSCSFTPRIVTVVCIFLPL